MRILVATDGSECAEVALDLVGSIDWPEDSTINVVEAVSSSAQAPRTSAAMVPATIAVRLTPSLSLGAPSIAPGANQAGGRPNGTM